MSLYTGGIVKQTGRFDKWSTLDFSVIKDISEKSVKQQKEYAGNWKTKIVNGKLQIEIDNLQDGKVDEVSIPTIGWTWHTHPRGCKNLDDCSIIPPSAVDLGIFAERWDENHMVISKNRIYWIQAKREYTPREVNLIQSFYEILETYFDDNSIPHSKFDKIFSLASKFGGFFTIYQFKNKKIVNL